MAIHMGWYSGRNEGVTRVDIQNYLQGTAIDVYMPYGLEDEKDPDDYGKIVKDEMIRPLLSGSGIKLILILPIVPIVVELRAGRHLLAILSRAGK